MRSLVATAFAIFSFNVYSPVVEDHKLKKPGANIPGDSLIVISDQEKFKEPSILRLLGQGFFRSKSERPKVDVIGMDPIQIEIGSSFPFDMVGENSFESKKQLKEVLPQQKSSDLKSSSQEKSDSDMHVYMKTVEQRIKFIERQNGFLRTSIDETIRCLENMQKAIGVFLLWQIVVFFLILIIMVGRMVYMRRQRQVLLNEKEGYELVYDQ